METNTKYKVVFYLNSKQEVDNLLSGAVPTTNYHNYQILKKRED